MNENSTDLNIPDLKIDIFEDLGLNHIVITSKKLNCSYGSFIIPDSSELVSILANAINKSNLLSEYTFSEVIQACTFFSDEEKEYYILNHV